jgi:Flp pilus assembly protein TadG
MLSWATWSPAPIAHGPTIARNMWVRGNGQMKARNFHKSLRRFGANRNGNFALMTGLIAGVLCLGAGYAVNTAQMATARSNLLAALDSAVTSTARDLTTGKISEDDARASVEAFLFANGGTAFVDANRLSLSSLEIDRAAKTVRARAEIDVAMVVPLFGMDNQQRIGVESAALYSDRHIEIAMMLDVTGSMAGQRMRDLKSAAKSAIDALMEANDPANPRVRISLVPYADAVNVGFLRDIVYAEKDANSASEAPPLNDPLALSQAQLGNAVQNVSAIFTPTDNCATEREGTRQFQNVGPLIAMVNRDFRLQFCPRAELVPLSADRTLLKARIDAFVADGHTAGPVGIQWSWYMLSPEWAQSLPAASRPKAHDPRAVSKYAILMTDGEFNTAYAGLPPQANVRAQQNVSERHAKRLCAEMKKNGIEVFTIGFMLNNRAAGVMAECATPDTGGVRHFFNTSSGAELTAAYQEIARNIESLALTQ